MLFNLIIGALAGYATRYVETPLGGMLKGKYEMSKPDLRVLTFVLLLLAASILISLGGRDGLPFVLLVGGGIGIFAQYLLNIGKDQYAAQKTKMEERKDSAGGSQPVEPRVKPAAKKPTKKTTPKK
tara:strand:- start:42469 stop:42846 length:378 start_codon:yes stop_codon:yes gene_type:complete